MLSLSIVLTVFFMYFIGVSGLRVLPLSINGWMDGTYRRTGLSGLNILHIDRYTQCMTKQVNAAETGRFCLMWYRLQSLSSPE